MENLLRASSLWRYPDLVRTLGGDPDALLAQFHIPADIAQQEHGFVPYRSVARLLEASAVTLNCPDFGLRLALHQGLEILGPIAVIARNAQTIAEAFAAIGRFIHIHSPAIRLDLDRPRGKPYLRMRLEIIEPDLSQQRQAYELSLGNAQRILSLLAGPDAHAVAVLFTHQRLSAERVYRDFFGCGVHFEEDYCGMHLPLALAEQRINNADPQTQKLATEFLEAKFGTSANDLSARVNDLIRKLLGTGQCQIQTVAEHLCLHPRTLQRRLAEENLSFETLLDQQRRELAARYLAESRLYLSQITGLLGYAEQSTFNRSCKRWFGMTPLAYRSKACVSSAATR